MRYHGVMRDRAPRAGAAVVAGRGSACWLAALLLAAAPAGAYTNLTTSQAHDRILAGGNLVVLDVREYSEFCNASRHLANAVNLPWNGGVLKTDYGKLPLTWDIIVYCASGLRSQAAATWLEDPARGFTSVFSITGGIGAWTWEREACEPEPLLFASRAGGEVKLDWIASGLPTQAWPQNYDLLRGRVEQITSDAVSLDLRPLRLPGSRLAVHLRRGRHPGGPSRRLVLPRPADRRGLRDLLRRTPPELAAAGLRLTRPVRAFLKAGARPSGSGGTPDGGMACVMSLLGIRVDVGRLRSKGEESRSTWTRRRRS